ncbi:MAG: hypothetical protein HKL96_03930 [Phycisphaerales bacterium]|nr:hypothetical protein [Phycisphaerales bacterium]
MKYFFKINTCKSRTIFSVSATLAMALCLLLAGCQRYDTLDYQQNFKPSTQPLNPLRQTSVNWYYQSTPSIPSPKAAGTTSASGANSLNTSSGVATTQSTSPQSPASAAPGRYVFTVPTDVTRVKLTTPHRQQYQLYWGRPKPDDVPFMTLTVARHPTMMRLTNIQQLQTRRYLFHGLVAHEWTGYTAGMKPFAAILLKPLHHQQRLYVVTIVPNNKVRRVANTILQTIRYTHPQD